MAVNSTFSTSILFFAQRHARHNATAGVVGQLPRYGLEVVAFGGILLISVYFLSVKKEMSDMTPFFALYAFAGYRMLPALQKVFLSVSTIKFNLAALDKVYNDLHSSDLKGESKSKESKPLALPLLKEIVLQDVVFTYPGAEKAVLNRICLNIEALSKVGIVGATGSGKTTIIDLILRLFDPESGQVLVDGVAIEGSLIPRWQRNLGYVPQHIYLSDDTIARNIAFGVPDHEIDMESVRHAAEVANLSEFILHELPKKYETVIGERGVRLSGGQQQRIGIARALYHDPAVLIMDEATSALDSITEDAVIEAIRQLTRKKTIIMIAHRLTTVKDCDVVYLLKRGEVAASGRYDELLHASEWFRLASKVSGSDRWPPELPAGDRRGAGVGGGA